MATTYAVVVPDASATEIEDCIAEKFGYTVADGTKAQFVAAKLRAWLKDTVCAFEGDQAGTTASVDRAATLAALIA